MAAGDLARGKSTAADLGAWLCFEDESGQGLSPPQGRTSFEQLVDQLVRELADEVALPVVAIHAVAGVEHMLLGQERVGPHAVAGEPCRGAQRTEFPGICVRPGVAGCDDQNRCQPVVQRDQRLAAAFATSSASRQRTITAGRRSTRILKQRRAASNPASVGPAPRRQAIAATRPGRHQRPPNRSPHSYRSLHSCGQHLQDRPRQARGAGISWWMMRGRQDRVRSSPGHPDEAISR